MAEEQNQDPIMAPEDNSSAQFQIQKLYTKDVSFEVPGAPLIYQESGQADVKMSLAQKVEDIGDDLKEISLTVTVTASIGEKTAYLVEVAQAGIFLVGGFNEQSAHAVINTMCPTVLFPYARQAIASIVADGGFPPLVLQPVNFDALYAKRLQEMAEEQQGEGAGESNGAAAMPEFTTND